MIGLCCATETRLPQASVPSPEALVHHDVGVYPNLNNRSTFSWDMLSPEVPYQIRCAPPQTRRQTATPSDNNPYTVSYKIFQRCRDNKERQVGSGTISTFGQWTDIRNSDTLSLPNQLPEGWITAHRVEICIKTRCSLPGSLCCFSSNTETPPMMVIQGTSYPSNHPAIAQRITEGTNPFGSQQELPTFEECS